MEATVTSRAGRFFGTLLLLGPALLVGFAGAVALHANPHGFVEWLLPWGALVSLVCTWVLLGRLWACALGEVVLAVAFAAYLLVLPLGYAIGEGIGSRACATGTGTGTDITMLYGYLGALSALGLVPIGIVVVASWRDRVARPGSTQ